MDLRSKGWCACHALPLSFAGYMSCSRDRSAGLPWDDLRSVSSGACRARLADFGAVASGDGKRSLDAGTGAS